MGYSSIRLTILAKALRGLRLEYLFVILTDGAEVSFHQKAIYFNAGCVSSQKMGKKSPLKS
ncbi:protein of unknown function [Serratia sp. Tan611]|nr:protein of unknown function [Serratia sp. Tan611]